MDEPDRGRWVEWLAPAVAIASLAWTVAVYSSLPDEVPIHFNFRGEIDGWGPRPMVWVLPVLLLGSERLLAWVGRHPEWGNYPVRVTVENRERLHRLYFGLMRVCRLCVVVVLATINAYTLAAARGQVTRLDPLLIYLSVAVLLFTTVAYTLRMYVSR